MWSVLRQSGAAGSPSKAPPAVVGSFFGLCHNGTAIENDVAGAAALPQFVQEQFSVDGGTRELVVCESHIGPSTIASLQGILSGTAITAWLLATVLSGHSCDEQLECCSLGSAGSVLL
jgi:hypothetical protein